MQSDCDADVLMGVRALALTYFMVSGDKAVCEAVKAIFEVMGKNIQHLGPPGMTSFAMLRIRYDVSCSGLPGSRVAAGEC